MFSKIIRNQNLICNATKFNTNVSRYFNSASELREHKLKKYDEEQKKTKILLEKNDEEITKWKNYMGTKTHFRKTREPEGYLLQHSVWDLKDIENVKITHRAPKTFGDYYAKYNIMLFRKFFDLITFYNPKKSYNKDFYIQRIMFLETLAGVPGMVGGVLRHLQSLRRMKHDGGWIHTLMEEAENERMHLMTFLKITEASRWIRFCVTISQGIFWNYFFIMYLISPNVAHRFVGYLEEEAVKTYTHCIKDIDNGTIEEWKTEKPPQMAIDYWELGPDATMRDLILSIRADEMEHRDSNHILADLDQKNERNPLH
jgi:threonyl-tRNA synthetase